MVTVATDSRARTLSALLAATDWPEREQKPVPRGVHPEAAALRKHVAAWRDHTAARQVGAALGTPADLAVLFARALNGEAGLTAHLQNFAEAASLHSYWAEHEKVWGEAVAQVQKHTALAPIHELLIELFDIVPYDLVIHPNLLYPTTRSLGLRAGNTLYSILPPRKAVGESPPWPFADDRDYVLRLAVHDFVEAYLFDLLNHHPDLIPPGENNDLLPETFRAEFPAWKQQVIELFCYGAQIVFLNRLEDGAGDAFAMFERRTRGLTILPEVVHELTNYVAGRGVAAQYASIAAYLPRFADHLDRFLFESRG